MQQKGAPRGAPFSFSCYHPRVRALLVIVPLSIGCSSSNLAAPAPDLSATPDLRTLSDLGSDGGDMGSLNCRGLNSCATACSDQACLMDCRARATQSAITKEAAVQACFNQWCPQTADMGTAVCARDVNGNVATACTTCVNNTQVAMSMMCANNPPECHQCLTEVAACVAD
jgi:hypothetical protein